MLHNRSALVAAVAGLTTALAGLGLAGCQKKVEDEAPLAVEMAENAAALPAAQTAEELDAPLAKVDDVVITVRDFQEQVNRQSPYVRARYTSKEQKLDLLDSLVSFEVLAKEAMRRGLDKDREVVRTMKQVMIQRLIKEEFADKITPAQIPAEELQAYYQEHLTEFDRPEQVRAAAIILEDKATAEKVGKEAKAQEGKSHVGFRNLVMKHSVDEESKKRGGDLGYFAKDATEVPKPVIEAAFGLEDDGITGPIDAGDGRFFIVKRTGQRRAMKRTFDQVKQQILNRVYRDKRVEAQRAFVEGLKKQSTITIEEGNLEKVKIEAAKAPPGGGHGALPFPTQLPVPPTR